MIVGLLAIVVSALQSLTKTVAGFADSIALPM